MHQAAVLDPIDALLAEDGTATLLFAKAILAELVYHVRKDESGGCACYLLFPLLSSSLKGTAGSHRIVYKINCSAMHSRIRSSNRTLRLLHARVPRLEYIGNAPYRLVDSSDPLADSISRDILADSITCESRPSQSQALQTL